jgi:hypothetical protein
MNAEGWIPCHSIDREDKKPSAALNVGSDPRRRGIYVDHAATGKGADSFFNVIARMPGTPFITGKDVYQYYGRLTGVFQDDKQPDRPGPTLQDVEQFQKNLTPEIKQFLRENRGLTEESLAKYRLGWCTKRERHAFPVFDESYTLVNVRFHNSKKEPKTLNWSGHGQARLWGLERLARAAPTTTVLITEGEFDAMLAEQETGLVTVSSTNGAKGFKPEWVKHFHGFHVVLLYDSDQQGREAVQTLVLPAFKEAVAAGQVLSIKVVWLYDKPDKDHKDFTDWIIKDGGSGARLKETIARTPPHTYPTPTSHLEAPINLGSFEQIDQAKHAGLRVAVPMQVFGENTVAYHAATKVKVTNCPALRDGKCTGRSGRDGACLSEIEIPLGERVMIAGVRASEGQHQKHLRDYVCDKDRRPAVVVEDHNRLTVREVYAHQVVGPMSAERTELVEKPVYVIGGDLVEIGKYQATGRVVTSYKDQQPTLLVDTLERMEEDYQAFDLEKARPSLEKIREMEPDEIIEDLSLHVTRIYERPDLHLGVLLTLCSPLWIEFPGEGRIRGWLAAITIGDTGTGKTTVSQNLFDYAQVGARVSGMTASRTGITYACDHDERRGWRIKAGMFLKMSRQALIVDEAQDLKSDDLKTMAEGLDSGITRIDRVQNKVFESATRVLFNCNPRHPQKFWEQKTMDGYRFGCESIKGIFPQMMIRRVDLVMFATAWDIKDKQKIFFPKKTEGARQIEKEDLQALIFYAWNLKPDQIIIDDNTAYYIRQIAQYLSKQFGACNDLPIVYPEDFRKTLARLCVAYAVLSLSGSEDFRRVVVDPGHVADVCEFLERVYGAENCNLHKYAHGYDETHDLEGKVTDIRAQIDVILAGERDAAERFHHIMYSLLRCGEGERLKKGDLADEFEVDRKTIQRDMKFFQKNLLIKQSVQMGYAPEPKLFRLLNHLEAIDPQKYCFGRPYQEVYG